MRHSAIIHSFAALFAKIPRILISLEINATADFVLLVGFEMKRKVFLFIENHQSQHFIPVSLSKNEFCGL